MLANVPRVAPSPGSAWRPMIERTFQREGVDLNIIADIDSVQTSLAIANGGRPRLFFQPLHWLDVHLTSAR